MVIVIRSSSKKKNMLVVSQEIQDYFSELVKPLATNEILNEMFKKLKEEIVSESETKCNEIKLDFETKYNEQNKKIEELKIQIALKDQTITGLVTKCDDNQQYSRHSCLRIHGIETKTKESNEDIIEKVMECYEALEIPFNEANIDRAHRIGREYSDKTTGKKVKSIIVKFKSWKSRQQLYNSRPRFDKNRKKKPGQNFTISVDLTKRRHELLMKARGLIKDNDAIDFVFSDINCSLGVKFNDSFKYFNSKQELYNIIKN